jgi:hypothetical protein
MVMFSFAACEHSYRTEHVAQGEQSLMLSHARRSRCLLLAQRAAIHSAGECVGVGDDALINHARKKDVVNITNYTHAL